MILCRGQTSQVVDTLRLSRLTVDKIYQNLGLSFAYNLLGIPVAAGVLLPRFGIALSPALCGALMGLSSVAVVSNSCLVRARG